MRHQNTKANYPREILYRNHILLSSNESIGCYLIERHNDLWHLEFGYAAARMYAIGLSRHHRIEKWKERAC